MSRRVSRASPRRFRLRSSEVDRWQTFQRLAEAALDRGALTEACGAFEAAYQEALETREHGRQAITLGPWVGALVASGEFDEAERRAREAVDLVARVQGATHPDVAVATSNLAQVLEVRGDLGRAEELLRQASMALAESSEPESWRVALENLGQFLLRRERLPEARELWAQLVEVSPAGSAEQARALHTLTHLADSLGDASLSDASRERCRVILDRIWGRTRPMGELLENMADSLASHGRPGPAAVLYEEAWDILLRAGFNELQARMHSLLQRWQACLQEERLWERASEVGQQLERALARSYGSRHPERGRALNELGMIEFMQGRHAAASELFRRALEETVGEEGDRRSGLRYNLACALQGEGRGDEAAALYREVLEAEPAETPLAERARLNLASLQT